MKKVMGCLQNKCAKQIERSNKLRSQLIRPRMDALDVAKYQFDNKKITEKAYTSKVKAISKKLVQAHEKLDKSEAALQMYMCSATSCQAENVRNLESLLRFQNTRCNKGEQSMCAMAKHTQDMIQGGPITARKLQEYTKKERALRV